MTRRELLLTSAAALNAQGAATQPAWCDRPMRWAQVAFTEDDPGNYDPQFWLDYFKRIHADAACLSAGGVTAFYPTKVPVHYRSKFLGDRDIFGELTAGCRKLGMNVIARIDPHACAEDVFAAHPDWVAYTADGKPRRHWADPERYVTCALGPYNFDFMTDVVREIVTLYKVDGVFANRWTGHGVCYCEHCKRNFKAFSGEDLPGDRGKWHEFNNHRLFELWDKWDTVIRAANPDSCYIGNSGGGAQSELDMKTIGEKAPILFADRQARRGLMLPWANGRNGKEYRAAMGMKPIGGIFSVGVEEPYRWKDSVQSDAEIRVWAHDGIAQGLRPWFTKFNAKPYDKRWMPVVEDIYNWHWRNEKYMRNEQNLARVAIVYSQQTAHYYPGGRSSDPELGFYQALVESRIPFEMAHDRMLDDKYKLLILPNIAALSDAQCKQFKDYVAAGGGIVATSETSLYDEHGKRRRDFGLAELFGCSYDGKVEERMQNSYLTLEHATKHPLLKGMDGVTRVINGVRRVEVKAHAASDAPLTLIPSYPDLPMERVYTATPHTNVPAVYCRTFGKGRVVYFPMDIDRTFWEVLSPDHLALLRNAVEWAAGAASPVKISGPGLLDVAVWKQKASLAVHVVNLTNPLAMKGPFRDILPVGPINVDLELPAGAKPKQVKLLTANRTLPLQLSSGLLRAQIPTLGVHEIVAIDLA